MHKFFISKSQVLIILFISFVFLIFFPIWILLIFFLIIAAFLYTHRKDELLLRGKISNTSSLFYSPVNGVVRGVSENMIKIFTSPLDEAGIYSPSTLEVVSFHEQCLELKNDDEVKISLKLTRLFYSGNIKMWLDLMDRAKCGACIGFQPFGGIVEIMLDSNINILIKKGDKVRASQTIIAEIKDINDN